MITAKSCYFATCVLGVVGFTTTLACKENIQDLLGYKFKAIALEAKVNGLKKELAENSSYKTKFLTTLHDLGECAAIKTSEDNECIEAKKWKTDTLDIIAQAVKETNTKGFVKPWSDPDILFYSKERHDQCVAALAAPAIVCSENRYSPTPVCSSAPESKKRVVVHGKIKEGMTKVEVRNLFGEPDIVGNDGSYWSLRQKYCVYSTMSCTIRFQNGIVHSWDGIKKDYIDYMN